MNRSKWLLIWCALCVALLSFGAHAAETTPAEAHKYTLDLVWIADVKPNRFLWQIEQWPYWVFQSLASETLRSWVTKLPANSTIEWWASDALIGGEPSGEELEAFKEFCQTKAVNFIVRAGRQ